MDRSRYSTMGNRYITHHNRAEYYTDTGTGSSSGPKSVAWDTNSEYIPILDMTQDSLKNLFDRYQSKVLTTPYINMKDIENRLYAARDAIKPLGTTVNDNYNYIDEETNKTNSNAYAKGTQARIDKEKLNTIKERVNDVAEMVLDQDMLNQISDDVKKYNEKLKELKKGARLKLLQKKADEINRVYKEISHTDKQYDVPAGATRYAPRNYSYTSDGKYKFEVKYTLKSTDSNGAKHYNMRTEKHAYINYWGWIKSDWGIFKIFDDDVKTLEQKIRDVGESLPYDPSNIIE